MTDAHSCDNCDGIAPESCLYNAQGKAAPIPSYLDGDFTVEVRDGAVVIVGRRQGFPCWEVRAQDDGQEANLLAAEICDHLNGRNCGARAVEFLAAENALLRDRAGLAQRSGPVTATDLLKLGALVDQDGQLWIVYSSGQRRRLTSQLPDETGGRTSAMVDATSHAVALITGHGLAATNMHVSAPSEGLRLVGREKLPRIPRVRVTVDFSDMAAWARVLGSQVVSVHRGGQTTGVHLFVDCEGIEWTVTAHLDFRVGKAAADWYASRPQHGQSTVDRLAAAVARN